MLNQTDRGPKVTECHRVVVSFIFIVLLTMAAGQHVLLM